MSKLLIGAVVAILAVIAVVFLVVNKAQPASPESTPQTGDSLENTEPTSLQGLMNLAGNQHCTFSDTEAASSGEVFVGSGKVRGNFTATSSTEAMGSHMISDGTTLYIWTDGAEEGFKASMADIEKLSGNMGAQTQAFDLNQQVDYSCSPWTVDNSVFNIPNIDFQDLGAMMEGTDTKALQCAACDHLPPESAASCKSALGC